MSLILQLLRTERKNYLNVPYSPFYHLKKKRNRVLKTRHRPRKMRDRLVMRRRCLSKMQNRLGRMNHCLDGMDQRIRGNKGQADFYLQMKINRFRRVICREQALPVPTMHLKEQGLLGDGLLGDGPVSSSSLSNSFEVVFFQPFQGPPAVPGRLEFIPSFPFS